MLNNKFELECSPRIFKKICTSVILSFWWIWYASWERWSRPWLSIAQHDLKSMKFPLGPGFQGIFECFCFIQKRRSPLSIGCLKTSHELVYYRWHRTDDDLNTLQAATKMVIARMFSYSKLVGFLVCRWDTFYSSNSYPVIESLASLMTSFFGSILMSSALMQSSAANLLFFSCWMTSSSLDGFHRSLLWCRHFLFRHSRQPTLCVERCAASTFRSRSSLNIRYPGEGTREGLKNLRQMIHYNILEEVDPFYTHKLYKSI